MNSWHGLQRSKWRQVKKLLVPARSPRLQIPVPGPDLIDLQRYFKSISNLYNFALIRSSYFRSFTCKVCGATGKAPCDRGAPTCDRRSPQWTVDIMRR